MKRLTVMLTEQERILLGAEARRQNVTVNHVIRSAVRKYMGMEPPRPSHHPVTVVTRNAK